MKKYCLIVDDENQDDSIAKLVRMAKERGLELECFQFSVGMGGYDEVLDAEKNINIEKVCAEYRKRFSEVSFDIVAFDWDLGDEIDGPELVRQLRANRILVNEPKIIYSGLMSHILEDMLTDYREGKINTDKLVRRINGLLHSRIVNTCVRDEYVATVISFLENEVINIDSFIQDELARCPDMVFKNHFPNDGFYDKKFSTVRTLCQQNPTMRNEFNQELIRQVLAYLAEMV